MSTPLLALVGLVYLWVAYDNWRHRHFGMALAFVAYALANVGLILALREQ